ncbi:hypothetical protein [Paenibacillus sp. NEAU-GSW1]|uniref:hypothetical protein n=1 Tax=Paenibacillus sp. NEAU-GSW1 TaxID=2682486 RepID=UPI0012E2E87C|nr:hypothetical protein [Paenibacillus sp. NEAU-GSW1]MUT65746.1 hypothetical protein [Paenibacillus sp. NEAU-GSW1]
MFDPTVFDNLKVAIENCAYDMDNIDGVIRITNRMDRLEMAVMSRLFAIRFTLADYSEISAELQLEASLKDLASELLAVEGENPACTLRLFFDMPITDIERQCKQINQILNSIWQPEHPPAQTLTFMYGQEPRVYSNTIELAFNRKINEDQMGDLSELLEHAVKTLTELVKV